MVSDLAPLLAQVRANPGDDACWLVIDDRLAEEGNPLGEYIPLWLKFQRGVRTDSVLADASRLDELGREWKERYAPWARSVSWWRWLTLRVAHVDAVLSHADDLRRIGLRLTIEVEREHARPDECVFDDGFTRLACMRKSETIENQNFGPGMDEEWHHWRHVIVWRVADREVLFETRDVEAEWIGLEFRVGGLYAIDRDHGDVRLLVYG